MSYYSPSDDYAAIAAVNQAETARAAAEAAAAWCSHRQSNVLIGLLDSGTASLELVASPGYDPGEVAIAWMYSPDSWLLWQTWYTPHRTSETLRESEAEALLIPLRYEGALYGLLWWDSGADNDSAVSVVLLANLLAARLHHLAVNRRWDTLLTNVNAFSRALSQDSTGAELWPLVHQQMVELFDTTSFYVGLLNPATNQLMLPLVSENGVRAFADPIPLAGLSRAVIQHGTPLLFSDLNAEAERLAALNVAPDADEPGDDSASWLGVPLRNRRGEVFGLISIQNILPNVYAEPDLYLLLLVAGQISLAVENQHLLHAEQERRRVASTLMEVAQVVNSTRDYEDVLERILEQTQRVVDYDSASILLPLPGSRDGTRLIVSALNGQFPADRGAELVLPEDSPPLRAYQSQQPLVIHDLEQHAGWDDSLPTSPHARSWLGVPMCIQNRVIGLMTLDCAAPGAYSESDASTVFALARQAAIAVENAHLLAQSETQRSSLEQRTRRLTSMHQLATVLSASLERDVVLNLAARQLAELFEVDHCGIVLLEPRDNSAALVAEYPDTGNVGLKIPTLGNAVFEQLIHNNRVLAIYDTDDEDEVDDETRRTVQRVGARSSLFAPLVARDQFIGSIGLDMTTARRIFTTEEQETFMTIAAQVALAIHNAQLYEEAVTINRLKSELLANMSHELRTPLNAIIGYSEMLLSQVYGELNPKQMDRLSRVHNGGRHLLALINDVLDLSKIESGQMTLTLSPISIAEVIYDVVTDSTARATAKGLTLHVNLDDALPNLHGDAVRIRQIVSNLVDNAIKFTDAGSITLQAALAVSRGGQLYPPEIPAPPPPLPDGNWVALTISDTGIGISPEDQSIIFDAFRQVDGSSIRRYEGTGLGLTLARQLVRMHQGYIGVSSQPGQGATFTVLLPLPDETDEALPQPAADPERPTILVIDDDPAAVQLISDYLSRELYTVVGTTNPAQALELARRLRPAAIITDVMMPTINGWEILRALKAEKDTADIPVIVLSVMEQQTVGFYLGAADYLTKPINRQALYEALERTVRIEPKDPILIVDDNEDDRAFLADLLHHAGYPVVQAETGAAALDWLAQQPASLIVLDLVMPGLSGFEVLERLRADETTAAIPVVIVTGAELDSERMGTLPAPVLRKGGISGNTLVQQVQMLINRSLHRRAVSDP
ncbi:MAG: response regulator [Chloroflexi bacterium]|nr:response regulator [Chloroflexota bacterium]